ncbi:MAG TPA: (Fe-S)-binding protein [Lachnoclostridium phytofermentans]|uniref:(Fe-S)-binding protein n=1 Tax=Lachnoclostridium phytofermentans TaxID=66219 RepID=A0A3D2X7B1_9FIRM|nr:DUF362 domain-containing protein [Lachnoclostridium sp.]HCL02435.1 (Fe-S)-binding protein [Lachnoclostridium phytofermentans]
MRVRRTIKPIVAITKNENESLAIEEGLQLIQFSTMISPEDVVVITPNWVSPASPCSGRVVGPESLRTIIRLVKSCNPKRIVVATGPGDEDVISLMEQVGFASIIKEEKVEFINLNQGPFISIDINHPCPSRLCLNQLYNEMTFLISFTQLKIHEEATISAAIKNITMGWPAGDEQGYPKKELGIHDDLHDFIAAMFEKFTIDVSIVSASPAMIGTGPHKGTAIHTGMVLCGTDPVSTDVVGARLLGFKPQAIHYLHKIIKKGLGRSTFDTKTKKGIHFSGILIEDAEEEFSRLAYKKQFAVDSNQEDS